MTKKILSIIVAIILVVYMVTDKSTIPVGAKDYMSNRAFISIMGLGILCLVNLPRKEIK